MGVIRILEREKIPIDLIVGTSVGSLVGAIYTDKKNSFELEWTAFSLEEKDLFDYTFISPTQGFVRGERLEEFVLKKVSARELQQMKIPLGVIATPYKARPRREYILYDKVCTMKNRVTLSIDPAVTRRAKKLAYAKRTSVSGLVEQFLRSAPITGEEETPSFVERWAGKFSVAKSAPRDLRMKALRARYHLKTR